MKRRASWDPIEQLPFKRPRSVTSVPSLLLLPVEIVELIASYLDAPSFLKLLVSCRTLFNILGTKSAKFKWMSQQPASPAHLSRSIKLEGYLASSYYRAWASSRIVIRPTEDEYDWRNDSNCHNVQALYYRLLCVLSGMEETTPMITYPHDAYGDFLGLVEQYITCKGVWERIPTSHPSIHELEGLISIPVEFAYPRFKSPLFGIAIGIIVACFSNHVPVTCTIQRRKYINVAVSALVRQILFKHNCIRIILSKDCLTRDIASVLGVAFQEPVSDNHRSYFLTKLFTAVSLIQPSVRTVFLTRLVCILNEEYLDYGHIFASCCFHSVYYYIDAYIRYGARSDVDGTLLWSRLATSTFLHASKTWSTSCDVLHVSTFQFQQDISGSPHNSIINSLNPAFSYQLYMFINTLPVKHATFGLPMVIVNHCTEEEIVAAINVCVPCSGVHNRNVVIQCLVMRGFGRALCAYLTKIRAKKFMMFMNYGYLFYTLLGANNLDLFKMVMEHFRVSREYICEELTRKRPLVLFLKSHLFESAQPMVDGRVATVKLSLAARQTAIMQYLCEGRESIHTISYMLPRVQVK